MINRLGKYQIIKFLQPYYIPLRYFARAANYKNKAQLQESLLFQNKSHIQDILKRSSDYRSILQLLPTTNSLKENMAMFYKLSEIFAKNNGISFTQEERKIFHQKLDDDINLSDFSSFKQELKLHILTLCQIFHYPLNQKHQDMFKDLLVEANIKHLKKSNHLIQLLKLINFYEIKQFDSELCLFQLVFTREKDLQMQEWKEFYIFSVLQQEQLGEERLAKIQAKLQQIIQSESKSLPNKDVIQILWTKIQSCSTKDKFQSLKNNLLCNLLAKRLHINSKKLSLNQMVMSLQLMKKANFKLQSLCLVYLNQIEKKTLSKKFFLSIENDIKLFQQLNSNIKIKYQTVKQFIERVLKVDLASLNTSQAKNFIIQICKWYQNNFLLDNQAPKQMQNKQMLKQAKKFIEQSIKVMLAVVEDRTNDFEKIDLIHISFQILNCKFERREIRKRIFRILIQLIKHSQFIDQLLSSKIDQHEFRQKLIDITRQCALNSALREELRIAAGDI